MDAYADCNTLAACPIDKFDPAKQTATNGPTNVGIWEFKATHKPDCPKSAGEAGDACSNNSSLPTTTLFRIRAMGPASCNPYTVIFRNLPQ